MILSTDIFISLNLDKRKAITAFITKLKKIDKYLYCSFDYTDGFYKVYKSLPYKLWGASGDFDGKGFYLFTIKTEDNQPRLPHIKDLLWVKRMAIKVVPYSARQSKWWTKYQF